MESKLTREKFDEILEAYIKQGQEYIDEHEAIKEILKPLVGKPINGRTLNEKRLNGLKFDSRHGMFHIEGKFSHLIGYQNSFGYGHHEDLIAIEKSEGSRGFEYFDACHGSAAKERIEQIQSLDREKAFNLFSQVESHFNSLRQLFGQIENENLGSYGFPAYYDVLRAIYNDDDNNNFNKLKLSDFYFIRESK